MKNRIYNTVGSYMCGFPGRTISGPDNLVAKRGLQGTESHLSELGPGEANRGQTAWL